MKLGIHARLDYSVDCPTDILIQIEAAANVPEQSVQTSHIELPPHTHFARVTAQDEIGERIWLRVNGRFVIDYRATVLINRIVADLDSLPHVPAHQLPGATVQYLMASRYCPADEFHPFVTSTFAGLAGGAAVAAIRDWVRDRLSYVAGASTSTTTAADTFIRREGVCRDYAHLMITLVRATGIPARMASVYAPGVEPPDFHAVAEVFVGNAWHPVDATGMATEAEMVKIGIGRDAADVAFMTAFGNAQFNAQSVSVKHEA